MKIYCTSQNNAFEDTLNILKKYEGKDIWVLFDFTNEYAEGLGEFIKVIKLDKSSINDSIYMWYRAVAIDYATWGDASIPLSRDTMQRIQDDDYIICDTVVGFSRNTCIHTPEEVYSTDELLEMFKS